jgi:rhomboid family protein
MFLPLKDYNPTLRRSWLTLALIAANIAVWALEIVQGPQLGAFLNRWGATPSHILSPPDGPAVYLTLVTSMFLHGGWAHIFFNMLFLWIFGNNVEDFLGRARFLVFYLACGVIGSMLHIVLSPTSPIPTVGASGAISGLLGAYLVLYPHARVRCVLFLGFFIQIVDVPAVLLISIWTALQILGGFAGLFARQGAVSVAYWAHIGGFIAGWLALRFLFRKERRQELWRSRWRQLPGEASTLEVEQPEE